MPRSMKRKLEAGSTPKALARPDPMFLNRKPPHGLSHSQFGAAMLVDGLCAHAVVAREWARAPTGPRENMDLTSTLERIEEAARRVSAGDLSHAEAVLTAQTVTLNAMFANLACRATETKNADLFERYLRLAFKAQSQCRATVETLAVLKNPPVFTRQANIASQQVVNNGTMVTASRAGNSETAQNKLLEAHGERLDGGEGGPGKRRRYGAGGRGSTPPDRERQKVRHGSRGTPTEAATGKASGRRLGSWRSWLPGRDRRPRGPGPSSCADSSRATWSCSSGASSSRRRAGSGEAASTRGPREQTRRTSVHGASCTPGRGPTTVSPDWKREPLGSPVRRST